MPSPHSQRQAMLHDNDVTRVYNAATRPMAGVSIQVRAAVIRAITQRRNISSAIETAIRPIRVPLVQAMTASYVMGQYRAQLTASRKLGTKISLDRITDPLGTWAKIVDFAVNRVNISEAELRRVSDAFDDQGTKAMDSMGGLLETNIRKAIADAINVGEHRSGTIGAVRRAFDASGMTNANPFLIETQARTQTQLAYAAGRLKAMDDPDIQERLWGYEYLTVGDDRVRPEHAALDGLRLPKDDPRWDEIQPPCGWNCRCTTVAIWDDEALATPNDVPEFVEVNGTRVRAGADEGFGFNPLDIFNAQYAAHF